MNTLQPPALQPAVGDAEAWIEGQARVVALDEHFVWLRTLPPAACGICATASACGSPSGHGPATATATTHWRAARTPLPGGSALALGDTVRVGVERGALTRAAWAAYALPLLAMLAAAVAAQGAGDAAAAGAALAGLLGGAVFARRLVRRWQSALVPVLLGRASTTGCAPAAVPVTQLQRRSGRP
jgi:positive regulator of sigma E activity